MCGQFNYLNYSSIYMSTPTKWDSSSKTGSTHKFDKLYQKIHDIYTNEKEYIIKEIAKDRFNKGCITALFYSIKEMKNAVNTKIEWSWMPEHWVRQIGYHDVNQYIDIMNPFNDYILLVGLDIGTEETLNACSFIMNGLVSKEEELNDQYYKFSKNYFDRLDEIEEKDISNVVLTDDPYSTYRNVSPENLDISVVKTYNDYLQDEIKKLKN